MTRLSTSNEREKNRRRERKRRAISARIFAGLRRFGSYKLPKHCDNNEVLKALCIEAGWIVEPDGTTYRKGCKPMNSTDFISRSISACSSYQASLSTSLNQSQASSSFASPASTSYSPDGKNPEGTSLIPWLKSLSSASSLSAKHPYLRVCGGAISAPVTPPLSSPNTQMKTNWEWGSNLPFFAASTPQSPGGHVFSDSDCVAGIPVSSSPMFSFVNSFQSGSFKEKGSSQMLTPLQSGTCSPAFPSDFPMGKAISAEFAFRSGTKGLVKAWEGERIHEDCGSDGLELTLACSKVKRA